MQVGIDVKCMHTNFGGRGLSGFGDKISLWSIKVEKFNRSESAQKIHASRGQCHVHVHQFWWAWSLRFWRYGYLSKTTKFPFQGMDYSPWSSKNLIDRNRLKKFMQIGIDVECMHTNFGGRGFSGFGAIVTFLHGLYGGVHYVFYLVSLLCFWLLLWLCLSLGHYYWSPPPGTGHLPSWRGTVWL